MKSNAGTDVWLSPCGSCTFTHVCFLLSIWGLYKADILPTIFTVNTHTHTPIPLWLVFISWNANWSIRDYSHLPALKGQPSLSLSLHYHHLFSFVILLIVWDFFFSTDVIRLSVSGQSRLLHTSARRGCVASAPTHPAQQIFNLRRSVWAFLFSKWIIIPGRWINWICFIGLTVCEIMP